MQSSPITRHEEDETKAGTVPEDALTLVREKSRVKKPKGAGKFPKKNKPATAKSKLKAVKKAEPKSLVGAPIIFDGAEQELLDSLMGKNPQPKSEISIQLVTARMLLEEDVKKVRALEVREKFQLEVAEGVYATALKKGYVGAHMFITMVIEQGSQICEAEQLLSFIRHEVDGLDNETMVFFVKEMAKPAKGYVDLLRMLVQGFVIKEEDGLILQTHYIRGKDGMVVVPIDMPVPVVVLKT